MDLDEVYEYIYEHGTGAWTVRCTTILAMQSLSLALESNVSPFIAECTSDLGKATSFQKANINSAANVGSLLGALLLVPLADIVGRWNTLFWSSMCCALFAFGQAAAVSLNQLIFMRAAVGFFGASWPVAMNLLEEYVTPEKRGLLGSVLNLGWSSGAVAVNLVAWWIIPAFGWRTLGCVIAALYASNVLLMLCLVESPRWLLSQGRHREAMDALSFIARSNGTETPMDTLKAAQTCETPLTVTYMGSLKLFCKGIHSLISLENRSMTLCLLGLWTAWNMAYQAIVIIDDLSLDQNLSSCSFQYKSITLLSSSEIVGAVFIMPFIDRTDLSWGGGRLGMQAVPYVFGAAASILCGLQVGHFWTLAFLVRAAVSAGTGTSAVHLPELYSTKHRATATGAANLCGILGSILAPYLVYSETDSGLFASNVYVGVALLLSTAFLLGIPETAQSHLV